MTNPASIGNRIKDGRINNFDFIRFSAASLVVFSHAFPLSYSRDSQGEPLQLLSNNQATIGELAVAIFFIISGFLITMSYKNTENNIEFFIKRSLRIFPGLIVIVIATAFLYGPIFTTNTTIDYFSSTSTYSYLRNILLYNMQSDLPGVFAQNPYPMIVNGSLWTLYYEFLCYLAVIALGSVGMLSWRTILSICLICICAIFVDWHLIPFAWRINDYLLPLREYKDYLIFFTYFFSGSLLYLLRNHVPLKSNWASGAFLILIAALSIGGFKLALATAGSYLLIYIAYSTWLPMSGFTKYGSW